MTSQPDQPDAGTAAPDILLGANDVTPDVLAAPEPKSRAQRIDVTKIYRDRPSYWGVPGEQDLAFLLGQQGWDVIYGPGGATGKSTFAKGIDYLGVKVNVDDQVSFLIADNKASGIPKSIDECSALTDNLKANLDALLDKVQTGRDFPQKPTVISKLTELITTIKSGGGHVDGVEFAISNAGGFARGPTDDLQKEFFKAAGLTTADGKPLPLGFIDFVSPGELADREALIERLGANPRSGTSASVTRPVILDPAEQALTADPVTSDMQGAWLAGLVIIETFIRFVFSLVPTVAERSIRQLQPEILAKLKSNQSLSGVLLIYIALVEDYSPQDVTDTAAAPHPVTATFLRWEWQYGPSADDAYCWWAAPAKLLADHSKERPPKHEEQYFWWFDRHTTTRYEPLPTKR